jgi:hypothetical protein
MMSAVTLPVHHRRPAANAYSGNPEDLLFACFKAENGGETCAIHCQIITPQVIAARQIEIAP